MGFITEDFLLQNTAARRLYHEFAAREPILDFHGHLPVADIASDRRFSSLAEIWLEGDHYKWRAMRANGVDESFCTGPAQPYDKFLAWARTVPHTLRNPLYHWTHLELLRYFGIDRLLDERTAPGIWREANEVLQHGPLTARGILTKFRVQSLCTTDDPADSLEHHKELARSSFTTQVVPTFRPDNALRTEDPSAFNAWVDRLGSQADAAISSFADFLSALQKRHEDFHNIGCRSSDHGLARCPAADCAESEASRIFGKIRGGAGVSAEEAEKFASFLMIFFGTLDAEKGWTKQLHLGAIRNANTRMMLRLGRDTGFDSIGDFKQADALAAYLDRLDRNDRLPKMILYNVNPSDNYPFATLAGSFQDPRTPGKIQFGASWWFLDQKEGIEAQLSALSNCGLLSRFVGMVTDSRSFMSFTRHEYFRRVLCNLLGHDMEAGLLPHDDGLVGGLIKRVCYANAAEFLQLPDRGAPVAPAVLTQRK